MDGIHILMQVQRILLIRNKYQLYSELKKEIFSSTAIDLLVSFIDINEALEMFLSKTEKQLSD